jgi:steroid delta-isomerase-like uncharacterized protein
MSGRTRQDLSDIAERWVVEGWQKGNVEGVLAMYSDDFVDLSHPSGQRATREDNARALADLYSAFPDFFVTIDFLIVDDETGRVAIRWTARGTHEGRFFGIEPTGNHVVFHGVETLKIENGLIVERTGDWDAIEILQQLGVRLWMG